MEHINAFASAIALHQPVDTGVGFMISNCCHCKFFNPDISASEGDEQCRRNPRYCKMFSYFSQTNPAVLAAMPILECLEFSHKPDMEPETIVFPTKEPFEIAPQKL